MRVARHIRGNRVLLYIVVCGILFLSLWIAIFGFSSFRQFWNMPQTPLIFPDSHTIITGAESHALGYDPMFKNIVDPYDREMNYPRIWQCLFWLPINSDHLVLLAGTFILLFFVGIFLFLKPINTQTALFLSAVAFSPSAIFGLQSGNNDLAVFFVVALALRLGYRSKIWGSVAMFFAAILKIFPIFGLAQLLTEDKRDVWRILIPLAALFLIYFWISLDDFRQIYNATPRGRSGAYGVYVLPMMIEKILQRWTVFPELRAWVIAAAPIFFYGVAGLIFLMSLYALVNKNASSRPGYRGTYQSISSGSVYLHRQLLARQQLELPDDLSHFYNSPTLCLVVHRRQPVFAHSPDHPWSVFYFPAGQCLYRVFWDLTFLFWTRLLIGSFLLDSYTYFSHRYPTGCSMLYYILFPFDDNRDAKATIPF